MVSHSPRGGVTVVGIGSVIVISFVSPEITISPKFGTGRGLDSTVQNGRPPLSSSSVLAPHRDHLATI